jgi:hypothetical protein
MSEQDNGSRSPSDDPLDAWIIETARASYRRADDVPRERIWEQVQSTRAAVSTPRVVPMRRRPPAWAMRVTALAAAVLFGVGIARFADRNSDITTVTAPASAGPDAAMLVAMAAHLERSEAVLTAARLAARDATPKTDDEVVAWARDLLTTTRLLRDVRRADDPTMQQLLDDLELALAQLVQFQRSGRPRDAVALRETLAERDLLTRLRGVSATPALSRDDSPRTE